MVVQELSSQEQKVLEQVLGYLNFSAGAHDPRFLKCLNCVFEFAAQQVTDEPTWRTAWDTLQETLLLLHPHHPAFHDVAQATAALALLRDHVLPGYLEFHRDLLFHQQPQTLFNSLFVGRACEATLRQGAPWDEHERISRQAIAQLNDYIGHRPVAALESQKIKPYPHEWVRPIPLYIRDVGVAVGRYRAVVEIALELLQQTDEDLLREAYFSPDLLDELAVDPRAYDFDHPANKRPNYHFGQWDPHCIDNRGFYRRYVVQQVTLDALMKRLDDALDVPHEERLFEAAAVLAGTIIMSTGVSGAGPDTHDSTVNLANLLPKIAAYRDTFYERLLARLSGPHGQRLREEAAKRRQPFGGARQHLNAELARRRAAQLEHVHLAAIFARMGFAEAARQEADVVPAASARMLCHIHCSLTEGDLAVSRGDLGRAAMLLEEVMDWLRRAIDCGAVVDPWNILGFDGNFSLFPALENSVRDHRVDELVALLDSIFALYSRTWSEAAARDDQPLCRQIARQFRDTARWWRKYAAHEVSSVEATDADDICAAAERVAHALNLWHKGGAAAEDVRFWTPHAEVFDSPKAYALVVSALLERDDFVASMALLVHWLGQAGRIGLERGDASFTELAEQWMLRLRRSAERRDSAASDPSCWKLARKFLDYLEANAEDFWQPPQFEFDGSPRTAAPREPAAADLDEETEDEEGLFGAAYQDMVYRDTTDDGIDGELLDYGHPTDDELVAEAKRLGERLTFLSGVARLWQTAASIPLRDTQEARERREVIRRWIGQAAESRRRLSDLLSAVSSHRLPSPSGDHDSMVEYDRVRLIKESILEDVIGTCTDAADASRLLSAVVHDQRSQPGPRIGRRAEDEAGDEEQWRLGLLGAVLRGDTLAVRSQWDEFIRSLLQVPLLYVPLAKGGDPHEIVCARVRQRLIQDLLSWLPRLGLVLETCQLIETAREMERRHPVGPGAVTEFDELFKIGYKALVLMTIRSAPAWQPRGADGRAPQGDPGVVVDCLKQLTQSLLTSWLAHSKTLRLSVLERLRDRRQWSQLVAFVERYGAPIFTQKFLNLANLRAILHRGVDAWLSQLLDQPSAEVDWPLLDALEVRAANRSEVVELLTIILEAVVENYGEYRDYNSMTTQSDRGELLYTLLDFLRLRTDYDRICWQLKPVIWAHELLVRHGLNDAAQLWRRELSEETRQQADLFLDKLSKLQTQYAMRMPTVADRLAERFVRPMAIDRIRALVWPAVREGREGGPAPSLQLLREETQLLTREPTGVGLDVPAWLGALEEEVDAATLTPGGCDPNDAVDALVPPRNVALETIQRQLDRWMSRRRS
jgi:hypothetical protein